ncbi:MAG: prepilin-type N-terminal cleavage/methylation domain-containing protein [Clostridia bacterium]|nr:prepilin-type N-terminal cleavage/methylation domain-containing protein [Clostridia bacterium]
MFYRFRKNKKGFTLVELIVVVAIIAILGTAAGLAVSGVVDRARKNTCISDAGTLATQINMYETDGEDYATLKAYITAKLPNVSVTWSGDAQNASTSTIADKGGTATVKKGAYSCKVNINSGVATAETTATK